MRVHDGTMYTSSGFLEDILDVDGGWKHSLALDVNGFVWSWGWNSRGQLGIGNTYEKTTPVQVLRGAQPDDPCEPSDYLKHIIAISAGRSGEHSLAVHEPNGFVYAWGRNEEGELGNGESGSYKTTPVEVNGVNDVGCLEGIIAVSAGERHSMGLERDDPTDANFNGCVYTWGSNHWPGGIGAGYPSGTGKLGNGTTVWESWTPVRVVAGKQDVNEPNQVHLKYVVAISAGWDHCMALEKDDPNDPNLNGRVYTWGNNREGWGGGPDGQPWEESVGGRLGDGTTDSNSRPVVVLSGEQYGDDPNNHRHLEHIIAISAGEGHSMALEKNDPCDPNLNGCVYTWGDNQYGQLGNDCNDPCTVPVRVIAGWQNPDEPNDPNKFLSNIVAISAGHWHSLAIDADGVIWVWGKTKDGRLGLADMAYADPCICDLAHRIPVVYDYNEAGVEKRFDFGIRKAIKYAESNDVLIASEGIYYENVTLASKALTLQSTAGNLDVVRRTVIDCTYSYTYGVQFRKNPGSTVAGFTITNTTGDFDGVYAFDCTGAPLIRNNVIRGNARHGIFSESMPAGAEIRNNWIYGNEESGIKIDNSAARDVNAMIVNNTIVGNGEYGIYSTEANDVQIVNCIMWDNTSGSLESNGYDVTYSCVEGAYAGVGNISSDPCFFDAATEDYHLKYDSNCVDAGDPNFVADPNETDIDGNPRVMEPNGIVDMGADEDFPHCRPDYNEWVIVGRPDCWCYARQCHGDADGKKQGSDSNGWTYVGTDDFAVLLDAWKILEPPLGPGLSGNQICADFDHAKQGNPVFGYKRVGSDDLNILIANWKVLEPPKGPGVPGDCLECPARGQQGEGSKLSIEEMLDWLAEIWLDPEVRKTLDADVWLKLYESLEEL